MDESLLQELTRRLGGAKGNWPQISRETGVPYFTIANIVQGKVADPRVGTVQRLLDWFHARDADPEQAVVNG